MRRPGEVQKWIKSQWWWPLFRADFKEQKCTYPTMTELLQKSYQEPIASAFYWDRTPEGFDFWKDIDNQFLDFYYADKDTENG